MYKYNKTNPGSRHLGIVGIVVLLALLASSRLCTSSVGGQYQLQQSTTIAAVAISNENMTATSSPSANAAATTTSVANGTTTTASIPNATLVEFVSNIEQIRGHLDQALINKKSGNNSLAQAHTLHPIEEVYSHIEDQLAN